MTEFPFYFQCSADKCKRKSLKAVSQAAAVKAAKADGWCQVSPSIWVCGSCAGTKRKMIPMVTPEHSTMPLSTICLTLPVPPSANRYWRNMRGRMVVSSEAQQYKKDVQRLTGGITPLTGDISLTIHWYRQRASGDTSNRVKCLEDAIQGICFVNDAQVSELHVYRYDTDKKNPRVEIVVTQLPAAVETPKKRKKAA